jgi:hypothetical protein
MITIFIICHIFMFGMNFHETIAIFMMFFVTRNILHDNSINLVID